MHFFGKIPGDNKNQKLENSNKMIAEFLKDSNIIGINPGYYPPAEILRNEDYQFKNDLTLQIQALYGIKTKNQTILDIGCGRGAGIYVYKKYFNFKEIHAIDYVDEHVSFCNKNYDGVNVKKMDGNNITYPSNMFDVVTITDAIWFCNDYDKFFQSIQRILKPNGSFIMTEGSINTQCNISVSKYFNNIKVFDITENVVNSCKDIIENIKTFNLSKEQENYVLWCSNNNLDVYKNIKYLKYVCKNDKENK
jgi:ubiquinone/menaquinone biosynthesis C-methylase UbiE